MSKSVRSQIQRDLPRMLDTVRTPGRRTAGGLSVFLFTTVAGCA